jgi:MoaA/NifB/PqqE/SkfB family radical SAM enzyme
MPTFVQLRLTNLCNLRCKMCGQWGDTGIFREKAGAEATDGRAEQERIRELIGRSRQMSLADYVQLLDELAPNKPVISLFGGEPFLYPEIMPLIREIKARGLTVTIITNGWFLERHARELVETGVDTIAVSVDGPPELHDRIRARDSSFSRLASGVRAVAEWRQKLGRALPVQMAILPITELNADALDAAVAALRELPLELVNIGLRWFVPSEAGARYEQVMQETFGVEGTSWKGFDFRWPAGADRTRELTSLTGSLRALRRRRVRDWFSGRPWTSFVPAIAAKDVPAYFKEPERVFGHDLCPVAWYFAQVEPDGEVCFCGDFPDYMIGNVRKAAFREIWGGPKAQAFREKLAREPLPICARCCGSFVYGKWRRPAPRGAAPSRLEAPSQSPIPEA